MQILNRRFENRTELEDYLIKRNLTNGYFDILNEGVIHFNNYGDLDNCGRDYILESPVELAYDKDNFDCPQTGPFLQFPIFIVCELKYEEVVKYILNNYINKNDGWTSDFLLDGK